MNDEKEKWMEEVFQSMKGSQRAKPRPDLFAAIEGRIGAPEVKMVPLRQWSYAAAAAVVLLALNYFALSEYTQSKEPLHQEMVVLDDYDQSLISNYNIYE